ncbi:MAG: PHP domain-containing protein [Lachnospiraceae bacterium]|nr:PHP domain-containing protein [Lachnospiraceae bacterium]
MTVNNIVNMAVLKGLDVVALTDHNSSKNCPAFLEAAKNAGIRAIPGMEINTSEEIHAVCLFPTLEQAMAFDEYVFSTMPPVKNRPEIYGDQILVDAEDQPVGTLDTLLITASGVSFDELPDLMEQYGGIFFPAHIDRSANSLLAILGAVPEDTDFPFFEVYHVGLYDDLVEKHPKLAGRPWLHNSDAHYLWDIAEPERQLDPRIEQMLRDAGIL